jgi:hypothetical protein
MPMLRVKPEETATLIVPKLPLARREGGSVLRPVSHPDQ